MGQGLPRPLAPQCLHQVSELSLRIATAQQAAGTLADQLIHRAVLVDQRYRWAMAMA
jgi:hypothetical protein